MTVKVFNTTSSPIPCSEDGRLIDGHTWGEVDPDDPAVKRAIEHGRLYMPEDKPKKKTTKKASSSTDDGKE